MSNSDELFQKIERLENKVKSLEKALEASQNPQEVKRAVHVTGFLEIPKTVKIESSESEIVAIYNDVPHFFTNLAIKVSLTAESYRNRTQGQIYLEKDRNGDYWIIASESGSYWLVPKVNIRMNSHKAKTLQSLFKLQNLPRGKLSDFILNKPGRVSLASNRQEWKLEELGQLDFDIAASSPSPIETQQSKQFESQLEQLTQEVLELQDRVEQLMKMREQEAMSRLASENELAQKLEKATQERQYLQSLLVLAHEEHQHIQTQSDKSAPSQFFQDSVVVGELVENPNRENYEPTITPDRTSAIINIPPIPSPTHWQEVQLIRTLTGHSNSIRSIAMSAWQGQNERQIIASGSFDGTIKVWNAASGKLMATLTAGEMVNAVIISPVEQKIVSNADNHTIKIWDIQTAQQQSLNGHLDWILCLGMSSDGQTLASGGRDGTIQVWDLATGEIQHTLSGKYRNVLSLALSRNGKILASSNDDNTIRFWNLDTGTSLQLVQQYSNIFWSVAMSPDGQTLTAGGRDSKIALWDIETGQLKYTLTGHSDAVWSVAFSPDGRVLASGSADKTIKLWNLETGELLCTLVGHTKDIYAVTFSVDGRTLISGGRDQILKVWQPSAFKN